MNSVEELGEELCRTASNVPHPERRDPIKAALKADPRLAAQAILWLCDQIDAAPRRIPQPQSVEDRAAWIVWQKQTNRPHDLVLAIRALFRTRPAFSADEAERLFRWLLRHPDRNQWDFPISACVDVAEKSAATGDGAKLSAVVIDGMKSLRSRFGPRPDRNGRQAIDRIDALLGERAEFAFKTSDAIGILATGQLQATSGAQRQAWADLLRLCAGATGSEPPKTWMKQVGPIMEILGSDLERRAAEWFVLLPSMRQDGKPVRPDPTNVELLKGLVWCCGLRAAAGQADEQTPAHLQQLAVASYARVPGQGRRCPRTGDASVWALMHWPVEIAATRLAAIMRQAKNPYVDETINTALDELARQKGVSRDELEELTIPAFGLDAQGRRQEPVGPATAIIELSGGAAQLRWTNDKGKVVAAVPAAVKREHAQDLARLKQEIKDLTRIAGSQRDRLDGLLSDRRRWRRAEWQARFIEHPLVAPLARRLIWRVDGRVVVAWDGTLRDIAGAEVLAGDAAEVAIWHPAESSADQTLAWRLRLEELGITQPFKQAHREVYLLTDAERQTEAYSNRFAAHLIRQHQFRALAQARRWTTSYIGFWDNGGQMPRKELPAWGVAAEFHIDAAELAGAESLPGGGAAILSTDQVRFYARTLEDGERFGVGDRTQQPLPLDRVPPLAFSEIMRDVDLFVGVASVGNDPNWQDGGLGGRFGTYWQSYSFGELAESAKTRRAVLERLVPRLKIRERCTLSERFLVVRGDLRTYRIHVGSGNILMEPNDQYLCIVADPSASAAARRDLFLPFEGDTTLSMILSKAFLLADDTKITDPTITRQIRQD